MCDMSCDSTCEATHDQIKATLSKWVLAVDKTALNKNENGTYTYTAQDPLKMSSDGMSTNGPKVVHGQILSLCINQYTECNDQWRVHADFKKKTLHGRSKCACGSPLCDTDFQPIPATPDSCDCEVETLRHPGDKVCTIM